MSKLETQLDYNDIIISSLSGNATSEEIEFLQNWVKESPENTEIFNKKKLVWLSASQLNNSGNFNTLKAFNNLTHKINGLTPSVTDKRVKTYSFLKIAASLLFMVIIGGIASFFITRSYYKSQTAGIYYFEAPKGSRAVATLPDGTRVWLNAESKLEYSTAYNDKNREVKLTGEAYFKVESNPDKPFFVRTQNLTVKATGTSFNVKAYPDEKLVATTLEEGKVELLGKGINNRKFSYQMKPKQNVVYFDDDKLFADKQISAQKAEKSKKVERRRENEGIPMATIAPIVANTDVKTELYTSWKDDRWLIESEKLSDLAVLFERRYNVTIIFASSEVKNYRFSATIENETIEQIFDIMRLTLPISYTADKGKITLTTDKKLKNMYRSAYQKE